MLVLTKALVFAVGSCTGIAIVFSVPHETPCRLEYVISMRPKFAGNTSSETSEMLGEPVVTEQLVLPGL